jgi:anti-sigma B factor antagonist
VARVVLFTVRFLQRLIGGPSCGRETLGSEEFSIQESLEGKRHTLLLRGDLDMASAPGLAARLRQLCEGGTSELVLDLSQLEFIDSTGLNAILRSRAVCEEHLCELSLIPGRRPVQRVFELTRLLDRLPFRKAGQLGSAGPTPL